MDADTLITRLEDGVAATPGQMTPYTTVDPDDLFRIESERRSIESGEPIRTRLARWHGQDIVAIDSRQHLSPEAQKALRLSHIRWLRALWGRIPSLAEVEANAPRIEDYRTVQRAQLNPRFGQEYDIDPLRIRFIDEELHAPYEVNDVEPDEAEAKRRFGRPLDDLLDEEVAELIADEVERIEATGQPVPTRRFFRGHENWQQAANARVHIGEYTGSAVDILE